jgi:hypothetical protein
MDKLFPRRPFLKRVASWTAGVMLAMGSYVASTPVMGTLMMEYYPQAHPVYEFVYAPVHKYMKSDLPGADATNFYCAWIHVRVDAAIQDLRSSSSRGEHAATRFFK